MKILKRILIVTSFVLVFVGLYLYLGMVLTPKSVSDVGGDKYYKAMAVGEEPNNSLDLLFMGDSNVYSDIMPLEIYSQTGIRSFDCGYGHQSVSAVKSQLKKLLKKQKPKMVVLDTDCFYEKNTFYTGSNAYLFNELIALYKFHARWKNLHARDFFTIPKAKADVAKGYMFSTDVTPVLPDYDFAKPLAGKNPLAKSVVKDVKAIKAICDSNGIYLLFIHCPTKKWSPAQSLAIQALADELGVLNYDMNTKADEIGIDFSKHYVAEFGTHMNYDGAKVVTSYVISLIKSAQLNNFVQLGDMRGKDKSWDKIAQECKENPQEFYKKQAEVNN